ncbi:DNA alkylation repair protein [Bifidobacterium pseudolongum subsp. globosum]|uniref:DNA alkylation repair protein n=1 Tax=Bifidobacterium pseudolongum subsp. globosum TaxID=1690 RepID=A0A4Q5AED9_9BIFI|nr:DNA alkylation repair protein [Bifidobacterium pseudolongum]RYQ26034.1 DNA alkylation repair protein [Bifidobacterium pseudolongum subsp. globosum]RYQ28025.1 DNA alkylation repair protein [Bifidobacterium pseudolongum subsp. globosum]
MTVEPDVAVPAIIRARLEALADPTYKAFNAKLIPNVDPNTMIGIRVPVLRAVAKDLRGGDRAVVDRFFADLPHKYFEENMLHAILLGNVCGSVGKAIDELTRFLPYADNWAVTDTIRIRALRRAGADARLMLNQLERWMQADATYTVRYAVVELMTDFLDSRFDAAHLRLVGGISSSEYYVNMARAWYFATALAKQWESVLPVLQKRILDPWTHNKTIQKACESYRVTPEHKALLRSLRV